MIIMKYCTHCFNKRLMLTTDCGQSVPRLLLLLVVALCGWCWDIVQMGRHWVARVAGRPSSIMAATGAESTGYWEDVVLFPDLSNYFILFFPHPFYHSSTFFVIFSSVSPFLNLLFFLSNADLFTPI